MVVVCRSRSRSLIVRSHLAAIHLEYPSKILYSVVDERAHNEPNHHLQITRYSWAAKDKRMTIVDELVQSVRFLKYMGWGK